VKPRWLLCAVVAWAAPVAAQDFQVERVVLLSRHGVRAPTAPLETLASIRDESYLLGN